MQEWTQVAASRRRLLVVQRCQLRRHRRHVRPDPVHLRLSFRVFALLVHRLLRPLLLLYDDDLVLADGVEVGWRARHYLAHGGAADLDVGGHPLRRLVLGLPLLQ